MCTLGAKKIRGKFYLFKTRDLKHNIPTRIVVEKKEVKKILVIDKNNHCEGLNEYGIGFVEATLKPHSDKRYLQPSSIGRKILNQTNLNDALNVISKYKISGNIIISDSKNAIIAERTPSEFAFTKIRDQGIITNHSIKLDKRKGSKKKANGVSSIRRYYRAKELVKEIKDLKGVERLLSDTRNSPKFSIHNIKTRCSFIYELNKREILFYKKIPIKSRAIKYKL